MEFLMSIFPIRRLPACFVIFTAFCSMLTNLHADDASKKLCWAHVVRWGFFQKSYDTAGREQDIGNVATDRTLLGTLTHERAAYWGNPKVQIKSAMQYGIDGFCIDMVDPKSYIGIGEFLKAAEGTDFKVALAMDNYVRRPADYCITHLGNYLRKYYNHPNHAKINGKPVVFIYNCGMNLQQWKTVVAALKEQNLDAYYLARASFEWMASVNRKTVDETLEICDGLYDFGCNGFTQKQMNNRIAVLAQGLQEKKPDGLLVAGIACGYLGRAVGNYRPFLNSGSTINNWNAVFANPRVNWVCITTWNDYTETTHIEPSVVNRDALARLNREYIRQWKNEPFPHRPAQAILSYHEEVTMGHDLTFEVLSFPYDCGNYSVSVKIEDAVTGKLVKAFSGIKLPKDNIHAETLRLTHKDMGRTQLFNVHAFLDNADDRQNGTTNYEGNYFRFYPVMRRAEHIESMRTIRLPFDEVLNLPMVLKHEHGKLVAYVKAWEFGGKLELLRNGYPYCEESLQHTGSPLFKREYALPDVSRSSQDVYMLRFTNVSDNIGFSNPVMIENGDSQTMVSQPVIVTGTDFEEDWPMWGRKRTAKLENITMPCTAIYKLRFECNEGEGNVARSSSAWKIPLLLAEPGRGFSPLKGGHVKPEWIQETGPDGQKRNCLKFYGDSVATLPVRTMPIGVFTVEALIKAERFAKPMILFGEQKPFTLFIQSNGKLKLNYLCDYGNKPVETNEVIQFDKWNHVAIVCSGTKASIYINGQNAGEGPLVIQTYPMNSLPALGNLSRSRSEGFRGIVAGYALAGTVLGPGSFQLSFPADIAH